MSEDDDEQKSACVYDVLLSCGSTCGAHLSCEKSGDASAWDDGLKFGAKDALCDDWNVGL